MMFSELGGGNSFIIPNHALCGREIEREEEKVIFVRKLS